MTYEYSPKGVCSQRMIFEIENNVVKSLKVIGGCNGNLQGISRLVEGLPVDEVIKRLEGIRCGMKSTSCPDQVSRALKAIKEAEENG